MAYMSSVLRRTVAINVCIYQVFIIHSLIHAHTHLLIQQAFIEQLLSMNSNNQWPGSHWFETKGLEDVIPYHKD